MLKRDKPEKEPKVLNTRIRLSEEDIKRLKYCSKETGLTKSEIIRQGIKQIYENMKNNSAPSR